MSVIDRSLNIGWLYVLTMPYLAAIGAFDGFRIGGYRYTGWLWVLALGVAPLVLLLQRRAPAFPVRLWAPWAILVLASLAWVDELAAANLQDAFQIVAPVVVGIAASAVVHTEERLSRLFRAFWHVLVALILGFAVFGRMGDLLSVRAMALTALLVGCVGIGRSRGAQVGGFALWMLSVLFTVASGARMATLALLALPVVYPDYRRRWMPLLAMVLAVSLFLGMLMIPNFRARFFLNDQGTVTEVLQGKIWGSGRFKVWPQIYEQASQRPVLGWGVGETTKFVPTVWEGMRQPHNDYLRIFFEQGAVGLTMFLVTMTAQLVALFRRLRRTHGVLRRGFTVAFLGLCAFLIISVTENALVYSVWYMNPLFAILGASYGVDRARRRARALDVDAAAQPTLAAPGPVHAPAAAIGTRVL